MQAFMRLSSGTRDRSSGGNVSYAHQHRSMVFPLTTGLSPHRFGLPQSGQIFSFILFSVVKKINPHNNRRQVYVLTDNSLQARNFCMLYNRKNNKC